MSSPRVRFGCDALAHQAPQLGQTNVGLVERGCADRALPGEERLGVENVLARGAPHVELLLADAQVLLRLADGRLRRGKGGEALGGGLARGANQRLELTQLPF